MGDHINHRSRRRWLSAMCCALCVQMIGAAGSTTQPAEPPALLHNQVSQVEDQLAALLERRDAGGASAGPLAEAEIDLRVLERWLLNQAADAAGTDIDLASCAFLRARNVAVLAGQIEQTAGAAATAAKLAPAQLDALRALHQLTYQLPPLRTVGQADEICRQIGALLLRAGGPLPHGMGELPFMRPAVRGRGQGTAETDSVADLSAAAQQLPTSPALRAQIIKLASEASAASADPRRSDDARALRDALAQAVGLARGLQQGGLVAPPVRQSVEPRLTDAIALFLDGRTRGAGSSRLDELSDYRRMLQRIREMDLPSTLKERLTPAVRWAQSHPEQGPDLLRTIEQFVELCGATDTPKNATSLPGPQKAILDGLRRKLTGQRESFLAAASGMNEAADDTSFAAQQLATSLDEIRGNQDAIELIGQTPAVLAALAALKPRPTGGLERRAMVAISAIGRAVSSPTPDRAREFLLELRELAHVARELSPGSTPARVDTLYARGRLADFYARRAALATELASQAAAGKEIDIHSLEQVRFAQQLCDAVREASQIESVIAQGAQLQRWVDWDISAAAFGDVLQPYRDATAAAVTGFADGDPGAAPSWQDARRQAEPLLAVIAEAGQYAAQCRGLPGGWAGDVAKLQTPMDRQPFEAQRAASFALGLAEQANAEARLSLLELLRRDNAEAAAQSAK